MNQDSTNTDCAKADDFVELLAQHDQSLTRYVMSLVPSMADSQDILQETKVALWRSFDSFETGTDFAAWSRKVALNRVLTYRKQKAVESKRLWFSENCYERLAEEFEATVGTHDEQIQKLRQCIERLQADHRQMLILRYFKDSGVEDVAAKVDRTVDATYRVLSRIRLTLRNCMQGGSAQ